MYSGYPDNSLPSVSRIPPNGISGYLSPDTFTALSFLTELWTEDFFLISSAAIRLLLRSWWVLFENRPAFYFCNYISITAHKLYNFGFRIKDTVLFFLLPIIIIMKVLLHNEYKIINLWYSTYVYQFFKFSL